MKNSSSWMLALFGGVLYCVNQWMAVNGIQAITTLLVLLLFTSVLFTAANPPARGWLPYLAFVAIFGFPEYSADPYLPGYISPFSWAKFPALISLFLMARPQLQPGGLLLCAMLALSTAVGMAAGRMGDLFAEAWYACLLLLALNASSRLATEQKRVWIDAIECMFYLLLPIALFSAATGMYENRSADTTTYFYGHWIGIVSTVAIYQAATGQSRILPSNLVRLPLMVLILYLCSASYQSAHYILFFTAALMAVGKNASSRVRTGTLLASIAMVVAIPLAGYFILLNTATDSWLYLKVVQVASLFAGDLIEIGNSATIRIAQMQALFEQGDPFSILLGRGMGSIYAAEGSAWDFVIFHEATYPASELESGNLQYIHESVTMLVKWVGLVGTALVAYLIYKIARQTALTSVQALLCIIFVLLFSSSLHSGILVTMLFLLNTAPRERTQ